MGKERRAESGEQRAESEGRRAKSEERRAKSKISTLKKDNGIGMTIITHLKWIFSEELPVITLKADSPLSFFIYAAIL